MKLSNQKLRGIIRRVILEAKFKPDKPLDRENIEIALGTHPLQQLKNTPEYKKTYEEMLEFVRIQHDEDMYEDLTLDSLVDTFDDYYESIAGYYGGATYDEAIYEMMLEDHLSDGTLRVQGNLVYPGLATNN